MPSLYAQYLLEREDFEIIEESFGFITFKITGRDCYIRDLFVVKEYRRSHLASELADKVKSVAKERQCLRLIGSVAPSAGGSSVSLQALLGYGFNLKSSQNDFIIFEMDI